MLPDTFDPAVGWSRERRGKIWDKVANPRCERKKTWDEVMINCWRHHMTILDFVENWSTLILASVDSRSNLQHCWLPEAFWNWRFLFKMWTLSLPSSFYTSKLFWKRWTPMIPVSGPRLMLNNMVVEWYFLALPKKPPKKKELGCHQPPIFRDFYRGLHCDSRFLCWTPRCRWWLQEARGLRQPNDEQIRQMESWKAMVSIVPSQR